jgi:ATP-binding cassette subfamily B (MDR/TAP) protein 1
MTPSLKAFAAAKMSGAKAFQIIDRKSKISIADPRGLKPTSIDGTITFRDIKFAYPLKKERVILNGVSFDIRKNEKTAFVGESGCGKTTCMQLIERFYDYENGNGTISLDGNELKSLNLKWMRQNIGYVGQEPVLFATSIKENLLMAKEDATEAQIWDALEKANSAEFVRGLPDKLNTMVGSNGSMLSGGQKQRLAIARAILKNPKILLLDEATSALDRKNEMEIQKTLDSISEGRTTIVIAHRLSTIINADHIIVFDQGKVVEEGRHEELVAKKGRYYALQHLQLQAEEKDKKPTEELHEVAAIKPMENVTRKVSSKDAKKGEQTSNAVAGQDQAHAEVHKSKKKESDLKIFMRLLRYCNGEYHLVILGCIMAAIQGCVQPLVAPILANMLFVLAIPTASNYSSRAGLFSGLFLALAFLAFISFSIQMSCFNVIAERMSRKVRLQIFQKYVRMPIGWFDDPHNSPGALGSRLSTDASLINKVISDVFGVYVQAAGSVACAVIISFIANWRLALVGLAVSPFLLISGLARGKLNASMTKASDDAYQESISFASEAVNNMRTVVSFGNEDKLLENYENKLIEPLRHAMKNAQESGLVFGVGQFLHMGSNALTFYVGAIFMKNFGLGFKDMFMAIMAIMMGCMSIGNAMQNAGDAGAATNAAINIFHILDTKPAIDIDDVNQTVRSPITGNIEFKNVWFKYPSREKQIFSGLNLTIKAGNKTAFVGPSGCGKSTILALIQRFYDVDQGEVLIDGINIKKYDLKHLRETYGVVSQEPVLFNGTIEYNIKYSKEDATDAEMRAVAEKACAIGFIEGNEFEVHDEAEAVKFGTGFHRKVGPKGSQMSGGQKQRIAIARAILKNPSMLILDEATSALDAQNEKTVQEALDKIMVGKTSIIVAHRISTIKDADEIVVFNEGQIAERGTYQELNAMQGIFYKLERGMGLTASS